MTFAYPVAWIQRSAVWALGLSALACQQAAGTSPGQGGPGRDAEADAAPDGRMPPVRPEAAPADAPTPGSCTHTARGPTRGSALALHGDGLVIVNRDYPQGSLAFVDRPFRSDVIARWLSMPGEPWQVVIDACGEFAYVVERDFQQVTEVSVQSGTATGRVARVGSEPTAIAISPNNSTLYVANWVDGTVTVIDARTMTVTEIIDLNAVLAADGKLGPEAQARPRRGLAHPRSIAITNDGDAEDRDETVFVTEFFARRTEALESGAPGQPAGGNADRNHEGVLYALRSEPRSVHVIPLPPLADTGFADSNGSVTGCFPNQVLSVAISGSLALVSSLCASPRGPTGLFRVGEPCTADADCGLGAHAGACRAGACDEVATNVKATVQSVIHGVNTESLEEVPAARVNLNAELLRLYDRDGAPDDASRRFPLVISDIAFVEGTLDAYLTANGADAVFRVSFDPRTQAFRNAELAHRPERFIDLTLRDYILPDESVRGHTPIGIAIDPETHEMYVAHDTTRSITVLDAAEVPVLDGDMPRVLRTLPAPTNAAPADALRFRGRRLFNTGLGRWSFRGQAWMACQSCHLEGLSDGVTWYLARGARQPPSLDGSFASGAPGDQRVFNWTAIFDEISDFEIIARVLQGGVGSLVHAAAEPPLESHRIALTEMGGLVGSSGAVATALPEDWKAIEMWIRSIRSPRGPTGLRTDAVRRGRDLFVEAGCGGCHGGPKWTLSRRFYDPSAQATAALRQVAFDADALLASGMPADVLPVRAGGSTMVAPATPDPGRDVVACALREVGTYGVSAEAVGVVERKPDMVTPSQGDGSDGAPRGFNVPSLLGLSVSAPYFHAGNARSLEELLSDRFAAHRDALSTDPEILSDPERRSDLVAFLLSIDENTPTVPLPLVPGPAGGDFCSTDPVTPIP